jgi:hypothetical protein
MEISLEWNKDLITQNYTFNLFLKFKFEFIYKLLRNLNSF